MPDPQESVTRYGRRVLGQDAYAAQQDVVTRTGGSTTVYGKRVGDVSRNGTAPKPEPQAASTPPAETNPPQGETKRPVGEPTPAAGETNGASGETTPPTGFPAELPTVEGLTALLEQRPDLIDDAIRAEFEGGQAPRKGALQVMRAVEERGRNRKSALKLIDNAMQARDG